MQLFERLAGILMQDTLAGGGKKTKAKKKSKTTQKGGRMSAVAAVSSVSSVSATGAWIEEYVEEHGMGGLVGLIEGTVAAMPTPQLRCGEGGAGGAGGAGGGESKSGSSGERADGRRNRNTAVSSPSSSTSSTSSLSSSRNHSGGETWQQVIQWFDGIANSLDCYSWLSSQRYITWASLLDAASDAAAFGGGGGHGSTGGKAAKAAKTTKGKKRGRGDDVKEEVGEGDASPSSSSSSSRVMVLALCRMFLARFAPLDAEGGRRDDTGTVTRTRGGASSSTGGVAGAVVASVLQDRGAWSGVTPEQVDSLCTSKALLLRRIFKFIALILQETGGGAGGKAAGGKAGGAAAQLISQETQDAGGGTGGGNGEGVTGLIGTPLFVALFRSVLEPERMGLGVEASNLQDADTAQRYIESRLLASLLAKRLLAHRPALYDVMCRTLGTILASPRLDLIAMGRGIGGMGGGT
jgi:hypothetical protein